MKNVHRISWLLVCLPLVFHISNAQDQLPLRGKAVERIEHFKKLRLVETIQMNEETSIRFIARYNKHMDAMRELARERNDLIDELEKLTKSKSNDSELDKVVKEIGMSEGKIAEERSKFLSSLKDILSLKQIGEYVVFERNFNRNLRELMKDITKDRWDAKK